MGTCISGQDGCPARDCHSGYKCQGHYVDAFDHVHLEDCISECNRNDECNFYTFEKTHDHCVLYEDCYSTLDCATCASGPKTVPWASVMGKMRMAHGDMEPSVLPKRHNSDPSTMAYFRHLLR